MRDIFSLNYDTILEASLDDLRVPYADGFRGANRAWFDDEIFDEKHTVAYRLFKLHGSVNWIRGADGHIRRVSHRTDDEPAVVYPSEQKYIQTQYGVYETLMGRCRGRLRSERMNNYLVVLGYSFNDEHINEAICDSVNVRGNNLTVVSFVGPEDNTDAQDERLRALEARCDSRFNAFVGWKTCRRWPRCPRDPGGPAACVRCGAAGRASFRRSICGACGRYRSIEEAAGDREAAVIRHARGLLAERRAHDPEGASR